ncbi:MAG: hypothetical protein KDC38_15450, partial [Planctomycetes bacterium]|nr:hypothetical protein [Planctomycetota bacterium]
MDAHRSIGPRIDRHSLVTRCGIALIALTLTLRSSHAQPAALDRWDEAIPRIIAELQQVHPEGSPRHGQVQELSASLLTNRSDSIRWRDLDALIHFQRSLGEASKLYVCRCVLELWKEQTSEAQRCGPHFAATVPLYRQVI